MVCICSHRGLWSLDGLHLNLVCPLAGRVVLGEVLSLVMLQFSHLPGENNNITSLMG